MKTNLFKKFLTVAIVVTFAGAMQAADNAPTVKIATSATTATSDVDSSWRYQNLGEVVVTTQKRSQSSIEVPMAVSAVTGSLLSRLNLNQMDEVANFTPGVQIQIQSPNNPGYVIRGVTSDDGAAYQQPRISVFLDGVSTSNSRASVTELYDMERVEVAKGPQGTLFGRGAEVGGISMIRNKARNKWAGEILANYGNYNKRQVSGFLNIPVVKDKFADRIAFDYDARDGFIKNLGGGRLNGKSAIAVRNSMKWWASANTSIDFVVDYQHDDYPGTSFKTGYSGFDVDPDPNKPAWLEEGKELGIKRNVGGGMLHIDHNFSNAWKLTSITAFRAFNSDEKFDADGTNLPLLSCREREHGQQWSQELRLNYNDFGKNAGFFGLNFFHEKSSQNVDARTNMQYLYPVMIEGRVQKQFQGLIDQVSPIIKSQLPEAYGPAVDQALGQLMAKWFPGNDMPAEATPDIYGDLKATLAKLGIDLDKYLSAMGDKGSAYLQTIKGLSNQKLGSYGEQGKNYGDNTAIEAFADWAYKFTPNFTLTAGLRGTYEHQQSGYSSTTVPGLFGVILYHPTEGGAKLTTSKNYWSWVGRLALNYMFGRNNVYASVSRGRRPGVIYYNNDPEDISILKPEIIYSYEIGIKGNVLDHRLAYDLCAYYYDWYHFQTSRFDKELSRYIASDAGRAHSVGIEASLSYALTNWLRLFGNYSFIDGKFNAEDQDGNEQEYAGNRFRLTPKNSFAVGADVNVMANAENMIFFRPTYTWKSKVYFEDSNEPELTQGSYGLANFSLGWRYQPSNVYYEVSVFGKNVFDEKYIIDAGNSGRQIGFPTYIAGTRALFGVQLKVGF